MKDAQKVADVIEAFNVLNEAKSIGAQGAIENCEKRGQQDLVSRQTRLPIKTSEKEKAALIQFGVAFQENTRDGLFIYVTLPENWKIVKTDHHMWSNLIDDKGVVRADIFYKASEQEAFITVKRRYYIDVTKSGTVEIIDQSQAINGARIAITSIPTKPEDDYYQKIKRAEAWLKEYIPEWEDPGAYW